MSADTWTLSSYLASEIIPLVIHSLELNIDLFLYSLLKNQALLERVSTSSQRSLSVTWFIKWFHLWGELWDSVRALGILGGGE